MLGSQTPFPDFDAVAVSARRRRRQAQDRRGSDEGGRFKLAACPEFGTRQTGLVGMAREYGVTEIDFLPFSGIPRTSSWTRKGPRRRGLLDGSPVGSRKYVVLQDPKRMFGFQHVAPIVSRKLTQENPQVLPTLNSVSRLLTLEAMIAMNKAVAVNKQSPAKVADAFLKANKLK